MADFIHSRDYYERGDVVIVDCTHQCNVMLTDDINFQRYRSGRSFDYHGGHFNRLPARIVVPAAGYWNVTLDLGGGRANIRYGIRVLKSA